MSEIKLKPGTLRLNLFLPSSGADLSQLSTTTDKLPIEKFTSIFRHLYIRDKYQCVLVSRKWSQHITSTVLYETLEIDSNEDFYEAFAYFDSRPHLSATVRNLTIRYSELDAYSVLSLLRLFPNVKCFEWTAADQDEEEEDDNDIYTDEGIKYPPTILSKLPFQKWKNIEIIKEDCVRMRILPLMLQTTTPTTTPFLRLREIYFSLVHAAETYETIGFLLNSLITNLDKVPNLQKFSLNTARIAFDELELIHAKASNLQELDLTAVILKQVRWQLGQSSNIITAVNKLESLSIDCDAPEIDEDYEHEDDDYAGTDHIIPAWINYIGLKYPNLLHLDLIVNCGVISGDRSFIKRYSTRVDNALVNMMIRLKRLKTYKVATHPITEQMVTAMDAHNIHYDTLQLYVKNFSLLRNLDFVISTDYETLLSSKAENKSKSLSVDADDGKRSGLGFEKFRKGTTLFSKQFDALGQY